MSCGSKGIGFGPEELLDLKIQEKRKPVKLRLWVVPLLLFTNNSINPLIPVSANWHL